MKAAIMLAQKIFILFIVLSGLKGKGADRTRVTCWQKAVAIERWACIFPEARRLYFLPY